MDIIKIVKNNKTLNLQEQQQRLILIALIRSKFDIEKAYQLNCIGSEITMEGYRKLIYKHFTCGIKQVKSVWTNRNKS